MGTKADAALAAAEAAQPEWLRAIAADAELEEQQEEALANVPITSEQLMSFAQELIDIEQQKAQLTADLKQVDDRRKQLRTQLIPDLMKALGMINSKGKGNFTYAGMRIQLEQKLHASVSEAGKPQLFEYLRKQGDEALIKETVNAQSLAAYVRECRAEGLNDPPGIAVFEEVTAKMVKAK